MKSFWRRYLIVIFLSFAVVTMAIIKYNYQLSQKDGTETVTPTATKTITAIPTTVTEPIVPTETEVIDADYPLWDKLPYSGRGFVIDRYTDPLTLAVKIKGIDKKIIKQDVDIWLEENGVNPETHEVVWE